MRSLRTWQCLLQVKVSLNFSELLLTAIGKREEVIDLTLNDDTGSADMIDLTLSDDTNTAGDICNLCSFPH